MVERLMMTADQENFAAYVARFWSKVRIPRLDASPDVCWEYGGGIAPNGYGIFNFRGKSVGAHRFSWDIHGGSSRNGLVVCHSCDNPACVRPTHLFLGTAADNAADMVAKGRNKPNPRYKVLPEQRDEIRRMYASSGVSQQELGLRFGVSQTTINAIVRARAS